MPTRGESFIIRMSPWNRPSLQPPIPLACWASNWPNPKSQNISITIASPADGIADILTVTFRTDRPTTPPSGNAATTATLPTGRRRRDKIWPCRRCHCDHNQNDNYECKLIHHFYFSVCSAYHSLSPPCFLPVKNTQK